MTVKFSVSNSKMHKLAGLLGFKKSQLVAFDLPAGFTCPMAHLCQSYANRETGKITDGKHAQFRCYAASLESAFTTVRKNHWANFEALRGLSTIEMADLLSENLPKNVKVVRVHASGDFFSKDYFDAWVLVASRFPEISFFGYTKVLPYVKAPKSDNFNLVYSFGGKMDALVTDEPVSYVVGSIADAISKGLEVSCEVHPADDYNFIMARKSFALVVHGTQPKGGAKIA